MEKRLGGISSIMERQMAPVDEVNEPLTRFGDDSVVWLGLPCLQGGVYLFTLVADTSVGRLGVPTGILARLLGIQVGSLVAQPALEGVDHRDPSLS